MAIKYYTNGDIKWRMEGKNLFWHNNYVAVHAKPMPAFYKPKKEVWDRRKTFKPSYIFGPNGLGTALQVTITYFLSRREILIEAEEEIFHSIEINETFNVSHDDLTEKVRARIRLITERIEKDFEPLGYREDFPDIPAYDEETDNPKRPESW